MNVLVVESSGNRRGSSNTLAAEFVRGAEEVGHSVEIYDAVHADIRPCTGCNACGMAGTCIIKDDYTIELKDKIRTADMICFVGPLYYYGVNARLKAIIDRFYSYTGELTSMHKRVAMICPAWDASAASFAPIKTYWKKLCDYMDFRDMGSVWAGGCGTPSVTKRNPSMHICYELGRDLH